MLHPQDFSKKVRGGRQERQSRSGGRAITICQHFLLWTSAYVLGSNIYLIHWIAMDASAFGCTVALLIAACTSLIQLLVHTAITSVLRKKSAEGKLKSRQWLQHYAQMLTWFTFLVWCLPCGLAVRFTITRDLFCVSKDMANAENTYLRLRCYVQRSSMSAAVASLIISIVLLALVHKTRNPWRYHLCGSVKEQSILPLSLPYKSSKNNPMFSDLSFKCRSSTSLSLCTLVPSFNDSRTSLLDQKSDGIGLGIYTQKHKTPSFLAPRPSLSSIRSYTEANSTKPPPSCLPPLRAYFPEESRNGSIRDITNRSRPLPTRYRRSRVDRTLRIVPPSPALLDANLPSFNPSQTSLSSVYSQEVSGERSSSLQNLLTTTLYAGRKLHYPERPSTILRAEIGPKHAVEYSATLGLVSERPSIIDERFDPEINDAATLQQRLPAVRGVSAFGDVRYWSCGSQIAANYYRRLIQPEEVNFKRQRSFRPLKICKMTSSAVAQPSMV